ncbi:uncharacterized protein T551_01108 [Pneumocystis jirovecii RU7]|uniref:Mitochondrial zinc maintenance protein 1, mitochondrial n=1 Tax=Pneumocystis jirovecii (strain RU7) TaxID=1408657 RepID=A0A0W4ZTY0_PNEJ7|nr:uncharacterized protein T551_01108 [Pneumocystis jirovecii RU7]KTW31847.1 hypothetical protein T551_01108 [Pneumocystis jirovecii RU7]
MTRLDVLSSYRGLLRATKITFKGFPGKNNISALTINALGDLPLLKASRKRIRDTFDHDKEKNLSEDEIRKKVAYANDVARTLRKNVVQGRLNQAGRYSLRIHHDTEHSSNKTGNK